MSPRSMMSAPGFIRSDAESGMFLRGTGSRKNPPLPAPAPREPGDDSPPMVCRMVFDELCILANGEIVCSCGDPAGLRVYGNVHKDKIADVFNGPQYREIRLWQLQSRPDSWCPVISSRCGGRRSRASSVDRETGRTVKLLQLEPTSYCNLNCPECPVSQFEIDEAYRKNRRGILPLKTMLNVLDQLPDLEKILFYNFGEPFLHKDAVSFLREVRTRMPDVLIHTNTNGLSLDRRLIDILAGEALLDNIVFSIDGSSQGTYSRYRVGGNFTRALQKLEALNKAVEMSGNAGRVRIIWQYILFKWNDSDEEIDRARDLAAGIGVPIKWVLTHTAGASRRFAPDSAETAALMSGSNLYDSLTCDLQMSEIWKNRGVVFGKYCAKLTASTSRISASPGTRAIFPIEAKNQSKQYWGDSTHEIFRLGIRLRTEAGRELEELRGVLLPENVVAPGGEGVVFVDLRAPQECGRYQLLLDIVEEHVCWFHERSSQPLILDLDVSKMRPPSLDWERILNHVCEVFLEHLPDRRLLRDWAERLHRGMPFQNFLLDIFRDSRMQPALWDSLCLVLWEKIQPLIRPLVPLPV